MTSKLTLWIAPALLAGTMALPAASFAQSTAPGTAASATAGGAGQAEARVAQRIAQMHAQLHITAAQKPQWDAFASIMRENASRMDAALDQRQQQFQSMDALDNMKSYASVAEEHSQDMQKLVPAFSDLYASLSPQQKATADRLFRSGPARH
jgi:hypothetical protein